MASVAELRKFANVPVVLWSKEECEMFEGALPGLLDALEKAHEAEEYITDLGLGQRRRIMELREALAPLFEAQT